MILRLASGDAMYELIYTSAQTRPLQRGQLSELLTSARTRNQGLDVSGVLLLQDKGFVQVLEGSEMVVAALFDKICKDPRHTTPAVMRRGPIPARQFAAWSMGFIECDAGTIKKLGGWNPFLQRASVTAGKNGERLRGLLSGLR
jgi:hypothetical protein